MRKRRLRLPHLPSTLPADVLRDGFDFAPTWEERKLDWHRQQIALALAEVRSIELLEQRAWLEAQTRRLALVAIELDEFKRQAALQEEIDRNKKWWAETVERERPQTEALMAQYQKILDKGVFEKMKARAEKAKACMDRDNARIERLELLRRGVVRGLRKDMSSSTAN